MPNIYCKHMPAEDLLSIFIATALKAINYLVGIFFAQKKKRIIRYKFYWYSQVLIRSNQEAA